MESRHVSRLYVFFNKFCTGGAFFPKSNPMLHRLFFFPPSFVLITSGGMAESNGLGGCCVSAGTVCVGAVCVGTVSGTMTEVRPAWVK